MVSLITEEEINEIFENFERLKKKSQGADTGVEARVSQISTLYHLSNSSLFSIESINGHEARRRSQGFH